MMKRQPVFSLIIGIALFILPVSIVAADTFSHAEQRKKAYQSYSNGNYKDALAIYAKLVSDPQADPVQVGADLSMAETCLRSLNRHSETDRLREQTIEIHAENGRLLHAAALSYYNQNHYGYIIAGEFYRGHHRGGGRYVNAFSRDRVRALQLMVRAMAKIEASETVTPSEAAAFYLSLANILMGYSGADESWRLLYLTNLAELPDYENGHYYTSTRGAPVNSEGDPAFHTIPESFKSALSDGERWRWALAHAAEIHPPSASTAHTRYADFLYRQFGVQTLSQYQHFFYAEGDPADTLKKTFQLSTLGEDETMARLATGIKRFPLPPNANFIQMYRHLADSPVGNHSEHALNTLAGIFENRRQYAKAARFWQRSIKKHGPGPDRYKIKRRDQILNNWGQFEPVMTHPAGKTATIEYRFRNGRQVKFEARKIKIQKLLADVKAYLNSDPNRIDGDRVNISHIGYRLVEKDETRYIGAQAAQWDLDLAPRKNHFDKRITVETPLKKAGAYLLTARLKNGNTSKIIIWINDTVIVKKQLDRQVWFFAADAVTGRPLPGIDLEFFGFRQKKTDWKKVLGRKYHTLTRKFTEKTDPQGQVILDAENLPKNHQWLITARDKNSRLAFLGFTHVWYGNYRDRHYNETRTFTITDRPVYRPDQSVKFSFWVRHAKYDQDDTSAFAHRPFTVQMQDPHGKKVFEKVFTTDAYGGLSGEYALPGDALLGVYYLHIDGFTGTHFRVEEYKKPEFEVTVEAPKEPIRLGEKFTARIRADYYFGAPVTRAKIKYKVHRRVHTARWYPPGIWDWFYGPGYGWFAYDYEWYPGWHRWGCKRPIGGWFPRRHEPPELVAEAEAPIGKDGTLDVKIDTALVKAMHGDQDHVYEITAEVRDSSRRTLVGKGRVLVARTPFKVYAWVDRGHYRVGDVIQASFAAQTLDRKPVTGQGTVTLFRIDYPNSQPVEKKVRKWSLPPDTEGCAHLQIKASKPGQYRLSYQVKDAKNRVMEGGYVFCIRGEGFDGRRFRFNEIELVPDKREYAPEDRVRMMINTAQKDSTIVLFSRPVNGIYLKPKIIRLSGKSVIETLPVTAGDMPNFFAEALTVSNGKLYTEVKNMAVPPQKRVLNVDLFPSSKTYQPGERAVVKIRLSDLSGKPFIGSTVISIYDKSLEYISGGSNIPDIKSFFWKWSRRHRPRTESSLNRYFQHLPRQGQTGMRPIGVFGHTVADDGAGRSPDPGIKETKGLGSIKKRKSMAAVSAPAPAAPSAMAEEKMDAVGDMDAKKETPAGETAMVQPAIRKKFADTAFWATALETDANGMAEVTFKMPENLTGWVIKTWAMGHGTKVGMGQAEVVTTKDLLVRLQAPRFFVEKDEVVLSANIHNYLENSKWVEARLEIDGGCLEPMDNTSRRIRVGAHGEKRVDWRVKVMREGEAVIRMKALSDEASDAMEMRFPVYVHGMLKTESFCGVIRPKQEKSKFSIRIPSQRRVEASRLEIRYSPTLAGAMVDALPYLAEYPYGCTEQTLSRFLPAVITQKIIRDMGIDLKTIREKRTNLNAQEIGDDRKRAAQWRQWKRNPVFDEATVNDMVKQGLRRLAHMQLSDGGWGWFSGRGEHSYPHTTAHVVQGLQTARENGVALPGGLLDRGIVWLTNYQNKEVQRLVNAAKKKKPYKTAADNLDALVYKVLAEANRDHPKMRDFLYRDRNKLAVYGKAIFGTALHRMGQTEKRDMILKNIEQYLVEDTENQTAYLNLPNQHYWWYWYGSEYEAHAYYLKLLARTAPKSTKAAGLVKYLLNNRKNATYWKSTRDTALCIEALADFLRASGEAQPDMTLQVYLDGSLKKEVRITPDDLFTFDNRLVLTGNALSSGGHEVKVVRKGKGPVYFNAYLTNFTLEDFINKAGLEIKVNRKYYRLNRVENTVKAPDSQGQPVDQRVEKYEREELLNLSTLKSGDLVEIELEIVSKNDYEYVVFEDMKAAGFEPVQIRSGYGGMGLHAYMELRDERVCFFIRQLARGRHSIAYRMRAEIPGRFSALPTRAHAMYAPELKANSDEIKLIIEDD